MYCKYVDGLTSVEWETVGWETTPSWIQCTYAAPSWWGDGIWSTGNQQYMWDYITPKGAENIYFGNTGATTLYYWPFLGNWTLRFQRYGLSAATSPVEFNGMWAKFGADASQARTLSIGWVSIAWQLLVGFQSSDNYIYMYASWNAWANNRHYEIKASKELSVWVNSWSYLYFKNYNDNNNEYLRYRIWVNKDSPMATLDIKWSIRVDTTWDPCIPTTCNDDNRWTIIYRWDFYWCTESGWKKFNMTNWSPNFTNMWCAVNTYNNPQYAN